MKNLLTATFLLFFTTAFAQDEQAGLNKWYVPDHVKLQFAGNIGFLSAGPGYISRNKTLETDLLFGFLPQKYGGDALVTITAKTTYSPWRIPLKNTLNLVPFSLGFYLNYTFGPQFDTKWPSYYPKGYYWWATSFRPGAYIGGKVGRDIYFYNKKKKAELYYELGTYDLLLISYVQNPKYLKPRDIVNLAFGLKIEL
ncbi:hypothetical protein [Dyadobacter sediminis]|uniref:Outer membrane protein beta-barrel domain-containing protein n=2 Tax=Dyadobacter sediminis TaxID=1493691 RepID=A0A5R9KL25_9BACT|nr:hypothetical protein [Dyadobacter sediminis]TLU96932.1 hypothetical protein FEM55_03120 [Dyadobacter sediminis]GGB79700.1 hypothetical protein GCM10011325_04050 [Dyadobacter sediminis]